MIYRLVAFSILALLIGCANPGDDDVVQLDGPILEGLNSEGQLEFNGAVVNVGTEPVRSAVVVIVLKDKDGRTIGASSTQLTGSIVEGEILPDERILFTMTFDVDPLLVFSKEVEIFTDFSPPPEE